MLQLLIHKALISSKVVSISMTLMSHRALYMLTPETAELGGMTQRIGKIKTTGTGNANRTIKLGFKILSYLEQGQSLSILRILKGTKKLIVTR